MKKVSARSSKQVERILPAAPANGQVGVQTRAEFERQVIPLQKDLRALALRYTRNPADADDLVQDTLMRSFAAWRRFIPGSNLRAWVNRILVNGFISTYRRRKRHVHFTTAQGEDAILATYGDDAERAVNPQREMTSQTLSDEVTGALAILDGEHRKVVELADLRGERYRDIADHLGVPMGTVMSRLFRARRQLEDQLRDYAAEDYGIRRAA